MNKPVEERIASTLAAADDVKSADLAALIQEVETAAEAADEAATKAREGVGSWYEAIEAGLRDESEVVADAEGNETALIYPRNRVAYTGTHDNDTTVGWWTSGVGHSTRSEADLDEERAFARRYLGTDGGEVHWDFIRAVLASVANTVIVPLQDVLGIGSEGRMNQPGQPNGNWRWRVRAEALTDAVADRLGMLATTYDRA